MALPAVRSATIDIVLDHHVGLLRGSGGRPAAIDLLPAAQELLREASQLHIPVRIAVPELLEDAAVAELEPRLALVEAVVTLDALELPDGPGPHVLVAADRVVRRAAADEGWLPVPHPRAALPAALGERLVFARLSGRLDELRPPIGVVPYRLERRPGHRATALALLTRRALAAALDAGVTVERLPLDPEVEDPVLVAFEPGAGAALAREDVLWSDGDRVLVAAGDGATPANGAGSSHGGRSLLAPSPELLRPALLVAANAPARRGAPIRAAAMPVAVTAEALAADVARYAGAAPLDGGEPVQSRHVEHPDNERVVRALLEDLAALGYAPVTHDVAFGGRMVRSVIAEQPGTGELGLDAGVIVLGCHIDGAGGRGADDDASGIAAVLAIARHLRSVREDLHHSVRLCFLNAEAPGLVGSRAYAAALKATGTPVTGVIWCDSIGFNHDGARTFEVHAGCADRGVRDLGVPLAELVANGAASFGLPAPVQVFRGMIAGAGDDPGRYDPAIDRAGHAAFQEQGYPAVLVSEDGFPQPPRDPAADVAIDADYAADVTRAVSIAVTTLAAG
ncbi:MAG: hypothetical protein QOD24_2974 [Solirubrobacteraceae bacterium]|nr:hypothetical protein [Solirubrobacteraceae bacterium]